MGRAGQGRAGQGRAGKEELCIYKSRVLLPVNKNSFCENHKDSDFNGVLEMNSYVSCIQRKP